MIRNSAFCVALLSCTLFGQLSNGEEYWWQFRGPGGDGHVASDDLVLEWNDSDNVAWKTAIHDRGWSSPVIAGDHIWLTTATRDGHQLFAVCVDKNTGKIVHDLHVFDVENPQQITAENTYATPTPVVHEGRVIVHFGTYGTACLDAKTGKEIWTRRDLNCDHETNAGPASSPTIIDGKLVVHVDGRDVQYVIALDPATGKTIWKTERSKDFTDIPVNQRKAFCMPIAFDSGEQMQIASPGGRAVYSYDLDGNELWRVEHRGFSVAPRPVFGHGMVFTLIDRDNPELWAIRVDGKGDVTNSHVVWKEYRSMPQRCSPVLIDDLLYLVNREGIATCLDAKTGELVWRNRLPGRYSASPIYTNDRIYYFNEDAEAQVIRPGREFKVIQANALSPQPVLASPAVDGNSLIVRTETALYRIEQGKSRPRDPEPSLADFVGDWDIGRNSTTGKAVFVMSLRADGTARKSHVPSSTGTWKVVNGEARVVWSEGWRDIIRRTGDHYRKIAFEPGKDFDFPASNTDTAVKQQQ
ncbi:MAG: PQQ-binding-like beta-propeller repeat protein [Planctomycetaceae bacterium]|nr:PQQ-binding-like beta-propeller repeat protein [Planctomycetaceae bacterium]